MTQDEIESGIAQAIRRIAPEADMQAIGADEDLRESLDIDSFDFLNFLVALHEKLGVDIPESDYAKVRTLGALTAYLSARTQ